MILNDSPAAMLPDDNAIELIADMPHARLLGLQCFDSSDGWLFIMPQSASIEGNPLLPAIHGGVIGGLVETVSTLHLMLVAGLAEPPRLVDFSVDYIRSGRMQDTFADCLMLRHGRRVANIAVTVWQADRAEPIAVGRSHFLLS